MPRGTAVSLDVVNNNRWLHGLYVHGHHFIDVKEPLHQEIRQYLNNMIKGGALKMLTDNQSQWLIRCHIIKYQAGGMVMEFSVVKVKKTAAIFHQKVVRAMS